MVLDLTDLNLFNYNSTTNYFKFFLQARRSVEVGARLFVIFYDFVQCITECYSHYI